MQSDSSIISSSLHQQDAQEIIPLIVSLQMGNLYSFFSFQQAFINPININESHMCASREKQMDLLSLWVCV